MRRLQRSIIGGIYADYCKYLCQAAQDKDD